MDITTDLVKTIGITLTLIAIFVVLPIVALLTEHQRKMALLMRGEKSEDKDALSLLMGTDSKEELAALRERVDLLESRLKALDRTTDPALSERLEERL